MLNRKTALIVLVMATLMMEIFGASLTRPEVTGLLNQEQTPADDRTFGLIGLLALGGAVKKLFSKFFFPAAPTY